MNKLFFCTLFAMCILQLTAQNPTVTTHPSLALTPSIHPVQVGISQARLDRLDHMLQDMIKDQKLPGLVALVARKGKIVYHKAYGYADFESKKTERVDDIFRIASMSKAITSTAVMMLYEEGKFSLDDPISKWIPEFKNPKVLDSFNVADGSYTVKDAGREITIRHLLSHTSGLGYGAIDGDDRIKKIYAAAGITELYTTQQVLIADDIRKLATLPLHHKPGEKFTYSMGLDVLGYFIEIISGESFADYLTHHVFKPLGMNDTYFYLPDSKKDRLVAVHFPSKETTWTKNGNEGFDYDYPIKGAKTFYSGGAGLSSTAKDYATFLQMLLNHGVYQGKRFLSRPTVDLLTQSNQVGDLMGGEKGDSHFSLGFGVLNKAGQNKGKGSEGTFSWGGYFNTNYWADPKEQIVVVLMKQTRGLTTDNSEAVFTRMVYQTIDD